MNPRVVLVLAAAACAPASARSNLELPSTFSALEGLPDAARPRPSPTTEEEGHTGLGSGEPADSAG